ncbi:MAG: double zinc ribbon domain-containing protein [Anaerolineae bacterium]|jgi:RNA polymerase subunit RPABC4/transcription elongation factor Spt4
MPGTELNLNSILQIAIGFLSAFAISLYLSLVIWTFRDIRARTRDVFAQLLATLLVVVFNLPGLLLYLILRPKETLAQAYERALEEEALLRDVEERLTCPSCRAPVEREFIICPECQSRLRRKCPKCARLLDLRWTVCPYCATDVQAPLARREGPQVRPEFEPQR